MVAFLKSELFVKFIAGFAIGVVGVFTLHPSEKSSASAASHTTASAGQSWHASAAL